MDLRSPKRRRVSRPIHGDAVRASAQLRSNSPSNSDDRDSIDGYESGSASPEDGKEEEMASEDDFDSLDSDSEAPQPIPITSHSGKPSKSMNSNSLPSSRTASLGSKPDHPIDTNLFNMQAADMLRKIAPMSSVRDDLAGELLRRLKTSIESIPEQEPASIEDAMRKLKKLRRATVPAAHVWDPQDAQYKLGYAKPAHINIVGSYALKTMIPKDQKLNIDMVVSMPESIFSEKDILNHRYFHKRAYYVACLAAGIAADQSLRVETRYELLHNNPCLPIIIVEPSDQEDTSTKPKLVVKIIPALIERDLRGECLFSAQKLLPNKNCLRSVVNEDGTLQPTAFYNGALRENTLVTAYLKLLSNANIQSSALRDAQLLGRIWLQQRGFGGCEDSTGFGNFEFSVLLALLLQGGGAGNRPLLSTAYDSQQLFRAALNFLANRDLVKQPVTIGTMDGFEAAKSSFGRPMLFDAVRMHNILYKMSLPSYRMLRMHAQASAKLFAKGDENIFEEIFIVKESEPLLRSDLIVDLGGVARAEMRSTVERLYSVLNKGFGDRAAFVNVESPYSSTWPVEFPRPVNKNTFITIQIGLNANNASRTVDRGPPSEEKAAASAFSKFWGSKAELRRFRDGSILHSIVWSTKDPISISEQIISYLMTHHNFVSSTSRFHIFGSDFRNLKHDVWTTNATDIQSTFTSLQKDLRSLPSLPLTIRSILPSSSCFSSTALSTTSTAPIDVVLEFERSARWPDNLIAIQATKLAFLLNLRSAVLTNHPHLTARVGLEHVTNTNDPNYLNTCFLDITVQKFTFRLRIHHDREAHLLSTLLASPNTPTPSRTAAATALASYRRTFIASPRHTSAITSLSTRFPAYAPAARLLSYWFARHRLSPHFRPETIHLLAARPFLTPHPWPNPPSSPATALLRILLHISRWNWAHDPWLVDLASASAVDDTDLATSRARLAKARTRFAALRRVDPRMERVSLFVAATDNNNINNSSEDTSNVVEDPESWTADAKPPRVVAARLITLAQACIAHVQKAGVALDIARLFKSTLKEYDFVLRINSKYSSLAERNGEETMYKNLIPTDDTISSSQEDQRTLTENVLALFVSEMQELYTDSVLFFYDETSKDVVCGLWNPIYNQPRRWKVGLPFCARLVESEEGEGDDEEGERKVEIDKEAILAEIARVGGDIIRKIEVKGEDQS